MKRPLAAPWDLGSNASLSLQESWAVWRPMNNKAATLGDDLQELTTSQKRHGSPCIGHPRQDVKGKSPPFFHPPRLMPGQIFPCQCLPGARQQRDEVLRGLKTLSRPSPPPPPSSRAAVERQAPGPRPFCLPRGRRPRGRWELQLPGSFAGREEGGGGGRLGEGAYKAALEASGSEAALGGLAAQRPRGRRRHLAWALTQGGSRGAGREGSRGGGVGNSSSGGSVVLTGRGETWETQGRR